MDKNVGLSYMLYAICKRWNHLPSQPMACRCFFFQRLFLAFGAEQNNQHPSVNKPLSLETGELFFLSQPSLAILIGFRLKRRTNFTTLVKRVSCEPEPSPAVINSAIWDLLSRNLAEISGVFLRSVFFEKSGEKGLGTVGCFLL